MANHPNRSASKIEILSAGQSLLNIYVAGELVAIASASAHTNGRWIMTVGDHRFDVTGIVNNDADFKPAVRLIVADPARAATVWPADGRRARCKDAIAALSM